ncbi:PREDICTED: glutamate receptor ionotropic, delta-1-like [Dufourea novaeangliae]|uniref:glutamate receptor ionotropic, delta-1-like n=1 Tax=Dufourea novaeangliae TaxID=178035 RepID=UPI000767AE82|nr:PREDICTED: glutamate receptor ionotropic, delta-1-like [Dufourea novaeangliae]
MARFYYRDIGVLLILSIAAFSMDVNDSYNYILLITDIHNYYGTSCIMIVHSNRSSGKFTYTQKNRSYFQIIIVSDFNETTVTQIWSRSFSRGGIMTMIVSFSDVPRETKKYQGRTARPLYVVLLTANETMSEFGKVTRQIDISFPVWFVMFLPYRENPMKGFCRNPIGNPFNLIFNTEMLVLCYDQPVLTEWYALQDNRTRVSDLAVWKRGQRFRSKMENSLYTRRNNLYGEVLRTAYVEESTFVAMKDGVFTQFLGAVVHELSKSLNFTLEVVHAMTAYGNWNEETQSWTGVIGEVVSHVVDIGVAEFSITNHRLDVVDFTLPLILSRNRVYFKKPDSSSVQWSSYFKAFNRDIWTGIVCIILTAPIILTLMKTRCRIAMQIILDNYISVWGIFCQQGMSDFPDESSLRFAFMSIFALALIIMSAYSASLISFLTVSTISLPFTTLEEFAYHGSYRLIVFKNSADYDMIVSANDSVSSRLKRLLKNKQDLPLTASDGFHQVCSGKVGFYVTEVIKDAIGHTPCEVAYIEANKIDSLAIALRKGSPYTGLMNYELQRFKDNGVLMKLRKTFAELTTTYDKGYPVVTLGGIAPILAILAGGIVFGCLILILEKMYYNVWYSRRGESWRFVRKLKETRTKHWWKPNGMAEINWKSREKRTSNELGSAVVTVADKLHERFVRLSGIRE